MLTDQTNTDLPAEAQAAIAALRECLSRPRPLRFMSSRISSAVSHCPQFLQAEIAVEYENCHQHDIIITHHHNGFPPKNQSCIGEIEEMKGGGHGERQCGGSVSASTTRDASCMRAHSMTPGASTYHACQVVCPLPCDLGLFQVYRKIHSKVPYPKHTARCSTHLTLTGGTVANKETKRTTTTTTTTTTTPTTTMPSTATPFSFT